jgi:hypothetical protein
MRTEKQRKMKRLRKREQALPRTVQKAPISRQTEPDDLATLEERAQGRAVLNDPSQHPRFLFTAVEPNRDENGVLHPPVRPDYNTARSGDLMIRREAGESLESFMERATHHWPVTGPGWPFTFLSFEELESELPDKPGAAFHRL